MTDINELRLLVQDCKLAGSPVFLLRMAVMNELLDRLEEAESDGLEQARLNGIGAEKELALMAKLEAAEKERDALRARIEEMEKQEPVAWMSSRNGFIVKDNKNHDYNMPLYLAPGVKGE